MVTNLPDSMRAVVFKAPFQVAVEDRPVPKIIEPTDAIVKISSTALCGSDLHYYRGIEKPEPGFICGHEFVGHIVALGYNIKNFHVGDHVVSPFFTCCGHCYFCTRGESSRCETGELFSNSVPGHRLDGAQAQYIRVPLAGYTLVKRPTSIPEEMLILMSDIFPTGYFAASRFLKGLTDKYMDGLTAVVIGCGPVGICAIASAIHLTAGRGKVFAVDSVPERLAEAERLGAIPLNLVNDPVRTVREASAGRGADVVMEVVGRTDALQMAFDMIRRFGKISSVGVHNEDIKVSGDMLYSKNVTMAFGRCPVRSIFEEALSVLEKVQDNVKFLCGVKWPLEDAVEAYKQFEARKVHKILFTV